MLSLGQASNNEPVNVCSGILPDSAAPLRGSYLEQSQLLTTDDWAIKVVISSVDAERFSSLGNDRVR